MNSGILFATDNGLLLYPECGIIHVLFPYAAETTPTKQEWIGKLGGMLKSCYDPERRKDSPTGTGTQTILQDWLAEGPDYHVFAGGLTHTDVEVRVAAAGLARDMLLKTEWGWWQERPKEDFWENKLFYQLPQLIDDPSPEPLVELVNWDNFNQGEMYCELEDVSKLVEVCVTTRLRKKVDWEEGRLLDRDWAVNTWERNHKAVRYPPNKEPRLWNNGIPIGEKGYGERIWCLKTMITIIVNILESRERRKFVRLLGQMPASFYPRYIVASAPMGAACIAGDQWGPIIDQIERWSLDGVMSTTNSNLIKFCTSSKHLQQLLDSQDQVFENLLGDLLASPSVSKSQFKQILSRISDTGFDKVRGVPMYSGAEAIREAKRQRLNKLQQTREVVDAHENSYEMRESLVGIMKSENLRDWNKNSIYV